jgi:hypothetical protein
MGIYHRRAIPRNRQTRWACHVIYCRLPPMRRLLPAPNLTALLALAALADLLLYRITNAIFLPSHEGTATERWLSDIALFASNFSGILALVLAVAALVSAMGEDRIFPRSMRITVSTVGLFFCGLAGIGVLWSLASHYLVHLRISHGFLTFFLALGVWRGRHPWRFKLGITLFTLPIVLQAFAIFTLRMAWSFPNPGQLAKVAHAMSLAAMIVAPLLLIAQPTSRLRTLAGLAVGALFAAGLGAAVGLRFDLVQASLFYGLHIDLAGMASTSEKLYLAVLVTAFGGLSTAVTASLLGPGRARLAGWGLLLIATSGAEISSAKPALFTLCGLLALVLSEAAPKASTAVADIPPVLPPTAEFPQT